MCASTSISLKVLVLRVCSVLGYYCCLLVDEEMDDEKKNKSLKPIGKKLKKKFKLGMKNRRSKGVLRGKRN